MEEDQCIDHDVLYHDKAPLASARSTPEKGHKLEKDVKKQKYREQKKRLTLAFRYQKGSCVYGALDRDMRDADDVADGYDGFGNDPHDVIAWEILARETSSIS
jgi:hypothetical protein